MDQYEELRGLLTALPAGDTTVGGRELLRAFEEGSSAAYFDRVAVLEAARRLSTTARSEAQVAQVVGDRDAERPKALSPRRSRDEIVLRQRNEGLVAALAQHVEERRLAIFGSRHAPFSSLSGAATWIESHEEPRLVERSTIDETERAALCEQLHDIGMRLREMDPWNEYQTYRQTSYHITYWRADGQLGARSFGRHQQQLFRCHQWAIRISEQTTLPSRSLLAYLLTDLKPGRIVALSDGRRVAMPGLQLAQLQQRSLKATHPNDPHASSERVQIDIDLNDVTDRAFRSVRQRIAEWLHLTHEPDITTKQQTVAEIVGQFGGPPPVKKYDRQFWERVRKAFNRRAKKRVDDPITLAKMFCRMQKRSQRIATDSRTAQVKAPQVPARGKKNARQSPRRKKRA